MFTNRLSAATRAAIAVLLFCLAAVGWAAREAPKRAALTPVQAQAVILAVEDEIYDFGYQKNFYQVAAQSAPGVTRLPLYIRPSLENGEGAVIYKLMPYGEVLRAFHLDKNGLAVLEGDPEGGFPPTQPNLLTVYLDDREVCQRKREWSELHFEVFDSPSAERVKEARERQTQRVGYSIREVPPREDRKYPPQ